MSTLRWSGGSAMIIGLLISCLLFAMFTQLSRCSWAKILFAAANNTCSSQRAILVTLLLLIFSGLCGVYLIVKSTTSVAMLASVFGLLYGAGLLWLLFFGMTGAFGGGLH